MESLKSREMKSIKEKLSLSSDERISGFPKKFNELVRIVEKLVNVVSFLLAILIALLAQSFLSGGLSQIFGFFNINWSGLSEEHQLLLLGFPLTVLAGILINVINKKYINPLLIKSREPKPDSQ